MIQILINNLKIPDYDCYKFIKQLFYKDFIALVDDNFISIMYKDRYCDTLKYNYDNIIKVINNYNELSIFILNNNKNNLNKLININFDNNILNNNDNIYISYYFKDLKNNDIIPLLNTITYYITDNKKNNKIISNYKLQLFKNINDFYIYN